MEYDPMCCSIEDGEAHDTHMDCVPGAGDSTGAADNMGDADNMRGDLIQTHH
jgi:hypothetical protein